MEKEKAIKIIKGCIWGVLILVLLFAIIAIIASPIAKHVVNTQGEEIIGRQLHAERVRVNLFTGSVTLTDFQCFEPNGTTNFFNLERLYVKIAYPRLLNKRVKIKHFHLDGFNAQVLQNNNCFNFSDIVDRFTAETEGDEDHKPWRVYVGDIQLTNSSVFYRDVLHGKEWQVENVNLAVPGIDFDNADTDAGIDFVLPTGGTVKAEARYLAPSNSLNMELQLVDVNPNAALPIVEDILNISDMSARMNGRLRAQIRLDNIQNIDLKGSVDVRDLRIRDTYRNDVAEADSMRVVLSSWNLNSGSLVMDSLILHGMTGTYQVHKNWNTLSHLLKSDEEQAAAKAKKNKSKKKPQKPVSSPASFKWLAKTAVLTAHDVTYYDYSQNKHWSYSAKSITAEGKNISSYGRNILKINAVLKNNAKMKADYTGGWDMAKQNTAFNVTLSNVRLEDLDAFCRSYTGYPIEGGTLFAETHMNCTSGKLTGSTRIVIDDPNIGKREKLTKAKYRDLPVRSTVKSLVDSDNRVVINAPVSADATKKDFSFSSVWVKSIVKETFGHMMRTKSKKDKISEDEQEAIEALIGDDTDGESRKTRQSDKVTKGKEQEPKVESRKPKEESSREARKAERDKRRNDRKQGR